jgi:hypothetical protein
MSARPAISSTPFVSEADLIDAARDTWERWYAEHQPRDDGTWDPPLPLAAPNGVPAGWTYAALVRPPGLDDLPPDGLPDAHPDHHAFHLLRFDDHEQWLLGETWVSPLAATARLVGLRMGASLGDVRDQLIAGVQPRTRRWEKVEALARLLMPLVPHDIAFLLALDPRTTLPDECYSPTFGLELLRP